jgi:hypothetical protein
MKTAVEFLLEKYKSQNTLLFAEDFEQAKEMEKEQAELYAEFAVLNDRSENPIIPFNEFINIDNL